MAFSISISLSTNSTNQINYKEFWPWWTLRVAALPFHLKKKFAQQTALATGWLRWKDKWLIGIPEVDVNTYVWEQKWKKNNNLGDEKLAICENCGRIYVDCNVGNGIFLNGCRSCEEEIVNSNFYHSDAWPLSVRYLYNRCHMRPDKQRTFWAIIKEVYKMQEGKQLDEKQVMLLKEVQEKIKTLEKMLKEDEPGIDKFLPRIHQVLLNDPAITYVLSDEDVGVLFEGMSKAQEMWLEEVVTKKGGRKKKESKVGLNLENSGAVDFDFDFKL